MENCYTVYTHINKTTKRVYVGCTKMDIRNRWRTNGEGYKPNKELWVDIQEFGWDGFTHTIIKTGLTIDAAHAIEIQLIAKYKSNNPKYGYNNTGGGFRVSDSLKGGNNPNAQPVESFDIVTGEVIKKYAAMIDVKNEGINPQQVRNCCRGRKEQYKGTGWRYSE